MYAESQPSRHEFWCPSLCSGVVCDKRSVGLRWAVKAYSLFSAADIPYVLVLSVASGAHGLAHHLSLVGGRFRSLPDMQMGAFVPCLTCNAGARRGSFARGAMVVQQRLHDKFDMYAVLQVAVVRASFVVHRRPYCTARLCRPCEHNEDPGVFRLG